MPDRLAAALVYAKRGWPVFPLHSPIREGEAVRCSCSRGAGCKHIGKHPRTKNGLKDATTDEVIIRAWWTRWPDANIGVVTGAASGVFVLDEDPRHGGDQTLAALIAQHGPLPTGAATNTGGGGRHIVLAHPGGKVKSREVAPGLDCKGDGGYVVAPPSVHVTGLGYRWAGDSGTCPETIPLAPQWVLALVGELGKKGKSSRKGEPRGASDDDAPIPEGQRNQVLTSVAGRLRQRGHDEAEIAERLLDVNARCCQPPMDESEVRAIAASIAKYPGGPACPYVVRGGYLYQEYSNSQGDQARLLANFNARIVADILEDDGAETTRRFEIRVAVGGRAPAISTVTAEQFTAMNWHLKAAGAGAIIYPGPSVEAHIRAAIQLASVGHEQRTIFGHTGWRRIGEEWVYLHAGGAMASDGLRDTVQVALGGPLALFQLPSPPSGLALHEAIAASLRMLDVGPRRVTVPILAEVFHAILGNVDHSLFIHGPTGALKSEMAALGQRFFGAGLSARNLPCNWSSTPNATEDLAFRTKDALLVVDDFKPSGDAGHDAKLHQAADRIFRGQGNHSARQRMRADLTQRPPRPPRGAILATGEDIPRGESLRARLLILELAGGDIDIARLTACQREGDAGLYAQVTSAFCQSIARDYEGVVRLFRARVVELRPAFQGCHLRQPGILAGLKAAVEVFVQFVLATTGEAVLTAKQAEVLEEQCRAALIEAGRAQAHHQRSAEPTARYLELLGSAISSGRAHVAGMDGTEPASPGSWGWRHEGADVGGTWRGGGDRVGWVDGDDLYLDPSAAFKAAQSQAPHGEGVPIGEKTLRRRLREKGYLVSIDEGRETLVVRKSIAGKRPAVLHLCASSVIGEQDDGTRNEEIPA